MNMLYLQLANRGTRFPLETLWTLLDFVVYI